MVSLEDAKSRLGEDFARYRETLSAAVCSDEPFVNSISGYVLAHKGKELRPVLSLFTGRLCGTLNPLSYYVAVVAEMLHSATLLHDDVADEAKMRRSAPTVSALFSSTAAVLIGDFWLSRALHVLVSKCEPEIISCFTDAVQKMAEGELIQMGKAESLDTTEKDYFAIIERKTSALFVACMKSAAYAVGASPEAVGAVEAYALHLGNAFQIRDDIFDYSSDLDTGKAAGADLKERKITLPLLCAMEYNPAEESRIRAAVGRVENRKREDGSFSADELAAMDEVMAFVRENMGIELAQNKLEEQSRLAVSALSGLRDCGDRQVLAAIAEYVGKRER